MTMITAHAGCENTVSGSIDNIYTAINNGADCVELDIRIFDGELFLSHDPINKEDLSGYTTLRQVLDIIKTSGLSINCDIKEEGATEAVLKFFIENNMEHRLIFTGDFILPKSEGRQQYRCFLALEHILPGLGDEEISEQEAQEAITKFMKLKETMHIFGINTEYTNLSPKTIALFHESNIPLSVWTVDDENALIRYSTYDLFNITTNKVSSLYNVLKRGLL